MTTRRNQFILLALMIVALLGVAAKALPQSPLYDKPTLGLDLQGGLEVVLEAVPPEGRQLTEEDLSRSVNIIRDRIDRLGVSEPEVRKQGENQISIQLAGVFDRQRAIEIIGKTAQLELYKFEANLVGPSRDLQGQPIAQIRIFDVLAPVQNQVREQGASDWYLLEAKSKKRIAGPQPTREALLATGAAKKVVKDGKVPQTHRVFGVPEKAVILTCGESERYCPGVNEEDPSRDYYFLMRYQPNDKEQPVPEMTGEDLKLSGTRQDFDTQSSEPIVLMEFTDDGASKFHQITRDIVRNGRTKSAIAGQKVLESFAIVLDREIKSSPVVDFDDNPDGIPGTNGAQITGIGSLQEAQDLALVLQTGALPIEFKTAETTGVSATLGKDSLEEAYKAALAGLALVAIFLLVAYRFLGLVAVIGLGIYAALLYATILSFDVTLTLPGFAGMILTIGVAADANIVIFERIKEENRAGKSVRAAISAGYSKGFNTIIDANVVTAITAMVLFAVATAGVKGFALMLLLGTAISLLTAVAATRAMLGLLSGFKWFNSPQFMGAQGQQTAKWLQIDFMGKRNWWFAISGAVLVLAIGSIAVKGLNFGIDFKGGTQVTFKTAQSLPVERVRAQTEGIGQQAAVIQGRGEQAANGGYRDFQIRTETLATVQQNQLEDNLTDALGARSYQVKSVSSSFGRQIANSAILAIIVSFLLIVAYISFRFQWKFALPVIAAIAHDVLITTGVYSLTAREVTTATVAAILTVLGYSMYDTIIIFDRIRENIPLMRRASFATLANVSLWETIRRSLATTFITLLPISALYFLGGDTLKDFAFALLIGIGSGAYSTVFIATPLLAMWKEREPEYARRIGADGDGARDGEAALVAAQRAAAAEPEPSLVGAVTGEAPVPAGDGRAAATKRERRQKRRRARPHGRAR